MTIFRTAHNISGSIGENLAASTAVGYQSLYSFNSSTNSTGEDGGININDALGFQSLYNTTTGYSNVGVGYQALYANIDGAGSTAVGNQALGNNDGSYNTALGAGALYANSSGMFNTAVGTGAMAEAGSGLTTNFGDNTAIGFASLSTSPNGGVDNTAVGYATATYTGSPTTSNVYPFSLCTFLGSEASLPFASSVTYPIINSTAIGTSAYVSTSSTIQLGNSGITSILGYGSVMITSDARVKKDIQENVPGLAFIKQLRPVTYHYDMHTMDNIIYGDKTSDYEKKMGDLIQKKEAIQYTGFIAQEVESAAQKLGYNFSGVKTPQHSRDMYALAYSEFVVPLVKAVQEQQDMFESQADTIRTLGQTIAQQQEVLSAVLAKMEVMSSQLNDIKECCNNNSNSANNSSILNAPQLFNAVPNPASGSTVVYYYVPATSISASIQLTDANGQAIQTIDLANYGYSSIPLQVGNLANSVYTYSLIVDGKLVNSKQLSIIQK